MRYRIGLCIFAAMVLALSAALAGPAPAGLASGSLNHNEHERQPSDGLCRGIPKAQHAVSTALLSDWLLGRSDLDSSELWLENWAHSFAGTTTARSAASQSLGAVASMQPAQTIDIAVAPNGQDVYSPNPVAINVGDTVRWNFISAGHNVISGSSCVADNKFCSPGDSNCADAPSLNPGAIYSHTFNTAGSFPYFCSPHCFNGMTGTIIVQTASTPTPTPAATPTPSPTPSSSQTVDVAVGVQGQKSFSPHVVVINLGDSVRWTFLSDGHNVVSGSSCVADNQFCSPGDTNCSFGPNAAQGDRYTHVFNSAGTFNYFCNPHCADGMTGTVIVQAGSTSTPTPTPTPAASILQFSSASYSVSEADQQVNVTITRSGDTNGAASVNFATSDGAGSQACNVVNSSASSRCDYISALGTLKFAAGEISKTVPILIINDSYLEGPETFSVSLSNPLGASLGSPSTATVTINDNETSTGANPIDQPAFFVTEHYYDFLNRLPDSGGLAFWVNEITSCGNDQACIQLKRINVSAAYFLSIEFQQTGYLVERMYKAAYGSASGTSIIGGTHQLPVPVVRFDEFLPDTQEIGQGVVVNVGNWQQQLENNKQAFALGFVQRSRFTNAFSTTLTPAQFVDQLFTNAGVTPSASDRQAAISEFGSATNTSDAAARGRALRDVAENSILNTQEFNRAFVLMQFFGYLRRNPNDPQDTDYTGYEFWLTKLNQFNGDFVNAEMVKAFITSAEYRSRFGP